MSATVGRQVATNVRRLRTARGLSLREMAARLAAAGYSLSADAINKIENGREADSEKQVRRVDVDDLHALAAVLGARPEELWAAPADCPTCHGKPPTGFICAACGAGPVRPDEEPIPHDVDECEWEEGCRCLCPECQGRPDEEPTP